MLLAETKLVEKKSKFFGYLYAVDSLDDVTPIIKNLQKKNQKAAHICYAAVIEGEELFKNDGEVGSPGKVLLDLLKGNNLDHHLLVVVRYFGGIKLGPGGVARAFRETGTLCIKQIT